MLSPVGQKEIEELAKTNERVAALEESKKTSFRRKTFKRRI